MKHERGHAERLEERDVDEQAEAEAEHGAGDRAGDEAGRGDEQRREVGRDAEDGDLRDGAELRRCRRAGRAAPGATMDAGVIVTASALEVGVRLGQHLDDVDARRSAAGVTWMRRSSSPSPRSIRLTVPIGIAARVERREPADGRCPRC